ncbi:hypothetical protein FOZ61_002095 [Perkinsus olseni]|uniref:Uncharacterized protein n=1 Tax=Perkinsus olseni TaxID=32597 RepID=A0A7J6LUB4_PEROL|nr:hypothetical protein FOZ61_002095 [Perkinsus olseni]
MSHPHDSRQSRGPFRGASKLDLSTRRPRVAPSPSLEISDDMVPHTLRTSPKYKHMMSWLRSNTSEQRSVISRQLHQLVESSILEAGTALERRAAARARLGLPAATGHAESSLKVLDEAYEWFVRATHEPHVDHNRSEEAGSVVSRREWTTTGADDRRIVTLKSRSDADLRRPRTASTYSGSAVSLRTQRSTRELLRPRSAVYERGGTTLEQQPMRPRSAVLGGVKEGPTLMMRNASSRPLTAASSRATFETASTVDLSRPVSAIKNTSSGVPSAGPCRAALAEVRKVRERKAVESALSRWSWEKGKLETESARNAETSGKAPSLTASDGFGLQGDPSCVMMKKVIHSSWLLPGRYDKRTREMSKSRGPRNDGNRRSDATARCALLLKMRNRRQEQLDEVAALAARLKQLGTEINAEVLERALVLPEQRLRDAASFPAMPRLLSDPNLPNAGAVAQKRRVIKKKGGKKKRAGIGRKTK